MASTGADAVGGALLEADGQPARGFAFRRLPTLCGARLRSTLVNQLWPGNPVNHRYRCLDADYAQQQEVEQPAGACLAVTARRSKKSAASTSSSSLSGSKMSICASACAISARASSTARSLASATAAPIAWDSYSFRDKQLFWYGNMLRYARKHFSKGQLFVLRLAIIKGMLLRSIGALFGARKAPLGESLRSYCAVVAHSFENRE